jgi:hypothetical protein
MSEVLARTCAVVADLSALWASIPSVTLHRINGAKMGWLDWLFRKRNTTEFIQSPHIAYVPASDVPATLNTTALSTPQPQLLNFAVDTVSMQHMSVETARIPEEELRVILAREEEEHKARVAAAAHAERMANVPKYPRTASEYDLHGQIAESQALWLAVEEFDADRYLAELCKQFRETDLVQQRKIVADFSGHADLFDFGIRMANRAIRERNVDLFFDGITAVCIDNESDYRETYLHCTVMCRAAAVIGPRVYEQCLSRIEPIAHRVPLNTRQMQRLVNPSIIELTLTKEVIVNGHRQFVMWFG